MRFSPAVVVSFILASSHAMRCCCAASFTARAAPISSIIISSGGGGTAAAAAAAVVAGRRAAAAVTAAAVAKKGRRRSSSLLLTHHDPRPTTTNGPLFLHQQQRQRQRQRHIFPTSSLSTQLAFGRTAASAWLPPRGGAAAAAAAAASSSSALYSTTTASATTDTKEGTAEEETKTVIRRQDYQPLPFHTDKVRMTIDIYDQKTIVTTSFHLMKNQKKNINSSPGDNNELVLDGDASCVKLLSIARGHGHHGHDDVGGATAAAVKSDEEVLLHKGVDYTLSKTKLVLQNPQDDTWYTTVVEICPETNTQLAGLYKSGDMYCTQCEANGFRRITYFPDRPDNMATFERVTIMADAHQYPVLLSNGNRIDSGMVATKDTKSRRHYAVWSDPFPKPSYLFAAVAGNLACRSDVYTTRPTGRRVALNVYSEPSNVHKLDFAMESLKQSMRWDEDRFDLEYDLDLYNIVATNDFNMVRKQLQSERASCTHDHKKIFE
jgi:Peptidase M1 N-terminal domain